MKTNLLKPVIIIVAAVSAVFFYTSTSALPIEQPDKDKQITKAAVSSIAMGIKSGNEGVKKCCIYFAGYYKLEGTVDVLIEQLEKGNNEEIKVLTALSLFKIGNNKSILALEKLAGSENPVLRKIGLTVLNQTDAFNLTRADE